MASEFRLIDAIFLRGRTEASLDPWGAFVVQRLRTRKISVGIVTTSFVAAILLAPLVGYLVLASQGIPPFSFILGRLISAQGMLGLVLAIIAALMIVSQAIGQIVIRSAAVFLRDTAHHDDVRLTPRSPQEILLLILRCSSRAAPIWPIAGAISNTIGTSSLMAMAMMEVGDARTGTWLLGNVIITGIGMTLILHITMRLSSIDVLAAAASHRDRALGFSTKPLRRIRVVMTISVFVMFGTMTAIYLGFTNVGSQPSPLHVVYAMLEAWGVSIFGFAAALSIAIITMRRRVAEFARGMSTTDV